MYHQKKGRKLSRKRDQRKALIYHLAISLLSKEKIKTTEAKAKEVRRLVERCITKSKVDSLSTRRYLARHFPRDLVKKMIEDLGKRYQDRPGGYTRIVRLGPRQSDGAKMVFIELVR